MAILKYLPSLLALYSLVNADCKDFTHTGSGVSRDYYTMPDDGPQRVSRGYDCSVSNSNYEFNSTGQMRCNETQCPIVAYGIVNIVGKTNLSLSEKDTEALFELVPKFTTAKPFFPYKFSANVSHGSSCLNVGPNVAGYYSFTPFLLCAEGVLGGCNNGPVDDGTAILICAADTYNNGKPQPNGQLSFLTTDRETVANLTSNPAATVSPVAKSAGSALAPGGGIQVFGVGFWLTVCLVIGSSIMS